jgi:predicted sugar kinase
MRRIEFKAVYVTLAMILLASVAHADLHYTMKSTTSAYKLMGKEFPAQETTINGWIGDSLAYMDMDTAAVLLNSKTGTVYLIDKKKKEYAELNMNNLSAMVDSATEGMDEKQAEAMQKMMKSMMGSAKLEVTATNTR